MEDRLEEPSSFVSKDMLGKLRSKIIALVGMKNHLSIYEIGTWKFLKEYYLQISNPTDVDQIDVLGSENERYLCTSHSKITGSNSEGYGGFLQFTNLMNGKNFELHQKKGISDLSTLRNVVSFEHEFLASESIGRNLYLWRHREGHQFEQILQSQIHESVQRLWVRDMIYETTLKSLLLAVNDNDICIFNIERNSQRNIRYSGRSGYSYRVQYYRSKNLLVSHTKTSLDFVDLRTETCILKIASDRNRNSIILEEKEQIVVPGNIGETLNSLNAGTYIHLLDFRKLQETKPIVSECLKDCWMDPTCIVKIDDNNFGLSYGVGEVVYVNVDDKKSFCTHSEIRDLKTLKRVGGLQGQDSWVSGMKCFGMKNNMEWKMILLDLNERIEYLVGNNEPDFCVEILSFDEKNLVLKSWKFLF